MTANAQSHSRTKEIRCEVRSPDSDDVLGYLIVGGTAACLEQALAQNGFWLVPVTGARSKPRQAVAAAVA